MDRSSVKEPNHHPTAIWISVMMSCVRALTSRSVFTLFGLQKGIRCLKPRFSPYPCPGTVHPVSGNSGSFLSYLSLSHTAEVSVSEVTSLISLPCCCSSPQNFLTVVAACSHNCSVKRAILPLCVCQYSYQCISMIIEPNATLMSMALHGL